MSSNYSIMTLTELKAVVKSKNLTSSIKGYHAMNKSDLITQLEIHAPEVAPTVVAEVAPVVVAEVAPVVVALKNAYQFKSFETVNPHVCDKLATMSFNDFLKFWDSNELNQEGVIESAKTQYGIITRYCQEQQKANYNIERKYRYSANKNKGRIFVEDMGLQRIYNQFRGCLCDGLYYDLDMINAHPVILLYICRQNGIPAASLSEYNSNRDHYLQELMRDDNINRDEAKRLFLTAINKSHETVKVNKKNIKNKFFLKFDKDIHAIQEQLKTKFPAVVKDLMTHNYKAKDNLGGCLTNDLMTAIENEVLQKVISFMTSQNIVVDVPMFDGIMPRASSIKIPMEQLILQLNAVSAEYGIKWSCKPHNTELKSRILSLTKTQKVSFIGNSVIEIGKYLWDNIFKSRIVSCGELLYLKSFTDNLYVSSAKTVQSVIHNYVSEQDLHITNSNGKVEPLTRSFKNVKNVVEHILLLASDTKNNDPNFIDTLFEKSNLKLNFSNGVYDFKTNKFISDPTAIEGFFKIKYDYSDARNQAVKDELFDRIINPMFGIKNETDPEQLRIKTQMRDCILYRLARAVSGHYEDKNWFMLEGVRNSGKGVLFGLLETAIGEYMTTCDSRNFLFKGSSLGNDSAKENMFLFGLQLHRIINIQEFSITPGKQSYINGGIIKSICSGGDKIETRAHYGMPVKIRCQASLMFAANEYPEISPANTTETCTVWSMNGKFINSSKGESDVAGYMNYPSDETIKQFTKRQDVGLAFLHILIDALSFTAEQRKYPEEVQAENAAANYQLDIQSPTDILGSVVRFTNSITDTVTNSEISAALIAKNIVMGKMLLAKQLKVIGAVPHKFASGMRGYTHLSLV